MIIISTLFLVFIIYFNIICARYFSLRVGSRGGADLEALIGEHDEATVSMDNISESYLLIVLAVALVKIDICLRGKEKADRLRTRPHLLSFSVSG